MFPPATIAQQKRAGSLLIVVAVGIAGVSTVFVHLNNEPWLRLVLIYLVAGVMAALGCRSVVDARRGTLHFDDQHRRRHYRAGYRAFWLLLLVIWSDIVFDVLEPTAPAVYPLIGMLLFVGSQAYDKHTE